MTRISREAKWSHSGFFGPVFGSTRSANLVYRFAHSCIATGTNFALFRMLPMAQKALCSCGCGKLVSASTDYRHRAGMLTPRAKATCLARQSITAPTTKFHTSPPQRKRQRTNPVPLPPLEIQNRGAIHVSGSSLNDVPLNHSETEAIEPPVNPCAEPRTNASRFRATVEDADSDEESDGDEGGTPSSESEDGGDRSLSDSDGGLGIEDTINDEFERQLGNFGAHLNVLSISQLW